VSGSGPGPLADAIAPQSKAAGAGAWLIGALLALQPLSTDLYLPTLPSMAQAFGADVGAVQWTLSIFIGVFGTVQLIAGPLSDRFGRRPLIVGGAALFAAGSLLCLLAPDIGTMIVARGLQAAGSCSCIVAVRAVVRDLYEPREGARTLAAAGTIMGFAPMFGPIAAATALLLFGWRSVFALLTGIGVLLLGITAARLAESNHLIDRGALQAARLARTYREIAGSRTFQAYALANTTSYAGLFTFLSASSFVLMRGFGLSPVAYAGGLGLNGAAYILGTLVCRRLMAKLGLVASLRIGARLQAAAGTAMLALPLLAGRLAPGATAGIAGAGAILAAQALYAASHGIVQPVAQAGCIAPFPRAAGAAAALMGFMIQVVAAALGVVIGATWNGTPYPMAALILIAGCTTWLAAAPLVQRYGRIA
jgi:MFS transporter, DHA1 family, multidrug resistance protein